MQNEKNNNKEEKKINIKDNVSNKAKNNDQ